MKNAKPHFGSIKFGKVTPDKTKYLRWQIEYDKRAERILFESGLILLKKDKQAVIEYAIKKALEHYAKKKK